MANGSACPCQPVRGCPMSFWRRFATYTQAGAPGPPLRYLYEQPTARSTPCSSRPTGCTPAEWHRSQTARAPTPCTAAVIRGRSYNSPVRKSTWENTATATSASRAAGSSGRAGRTCRPNRSATESTMYLSVGNVASSTTTVRRPGRNRDAAATVLNRFTEVESVTTTWPGAAPTSRPTRSPTRAGASHQPLLVHEPIRSVPHCRETTSATAAGTAAGSAPSELPSR